MFTPLHGGVVVGRGATGCVLRPAVPCEGQPAASAANMVSKVMRVGNAQDEAARLARIKTQIAPLPAEYQDLLVLGNAPCVPSRIQDADLEDMSAKCGLLMSAAEKAELVQGRNANYRVINQVDGGIAVADIIPTLTTANDLTFFCRLCVRVMQAVRAMNDRGVVHSDIKIQNLVMSAATAAGGAPTIRVIDWSHAFLISDLYSVTGLRATQNMGGSEVRAYECPYYHPPWIGLFDLDPRELDQVYAYNQADPATSDNTLPIRLAVFLVNRATTTSGYAAQQARLRCQAWTTLLEVSPVSAENRAAMEDVFAPYLPPGAGIGGMSRECTLLFAASILTRILKLTDASARNELADCSARYDIDMYGIVVAMVVVLSALTGVTTPHFQEARLNILRELAPHLLEEEPVDIDFLKSRLKRTYRVEPECSPRRALPAPGVVLPPEVPGGAAAEVTHGEGHAHDVDITGFTPEMEATLLPRVQMLSLFDDEPLAAPPAAAEYSPGFFETLRHFLDTSPDVAPERKRKRTQG